MDGWSAIHLRLGPTIERSGRNNAYRWLGATRASRGRAQSPNRLTARSASGAKPAIIWNVCSMSGKTSR
jgi:hypothetical protein